MSVNSKFCNCVFHHENQFGLIKHIVQVEGEIFFVCKKLINLSNNITNLTFDELKSHFSFFSISQTLFLLHYSCLSKIKKVFLYNLNENNMCLITKFTSSHLFS